MVYMHDMHCHLDFMANAEEVVRDATADGTLLFANTVTPDGWSAARQQFSSFPNVIVGCGMHPWWVDSAACGEPSESERKSQRSADRAREVQAVRHRNETDELACAQRAEVLRFFKRENPSVIGEIGLDFGWKHVGSKDAQLRMFSAIAAWAAEQGGKLVSIHSVKAAREVIETLESSGLARMCTCVFHWYTGSSELLKRAIELECYFSCGPRMLATRKGREYVKAIPVTQLLLETDAPPERGTRYSYTELRAELDSVALSIADIKGPAALETIARTSAELLHRFGR